MRRLLVAVLATFAVLGLSVGPALAGGWAVTTLDQMPTTLEAGRTYRIGYTIRQHGEHPVDVAKFGGSTELVLRKYSPDQELRFEGRPDGPVGHYVAEVRVPTAGRWSWLVTQGPFQPQPLGEYVVQPPAPLPATPVPMAPRAPAALPALLLPLMVGSAVALLAGLVFALRRESRLAGETGR